MRNKIAITALLIFSVTFGVARSTHAQLLSRGFGGIRIMTEYCVEGSGTWYAITVLDFATGLPLRLAYIPVASRLFLNFNIFTSTYLLGSYAPLEKLECNGVFTNGTLDWGPGTGTSAL